MQPDTLLAPDTAHYVDQFAQLNKGFADEDTAWFDDQRRQYLARFSKIGFPTQRDEDWRYTPLRPITSKNFNVVTAPERDVDLSGFKIPALHSHQIVFVDGHLDRKQSALDLSQDGVSIQPLSAVLRENPDLVEKYFGRPVKNNSHGFTALNGALYEDGAVIKIAAGAHIKKPIELIFLSRTGMAISQPRNLVVAGRNSKAQIIERYISNSTAHTLTNSTTEIIVGHHAAIDYYIVQTQSPSAYQVCGVWVKQARGSRFSCRTITLGGGLVRNDLRVALNGSGAHCGLLGAYSVSGKQHVDNHTTIVHQAGNCTSNELYKGVLDQRARAVFHGRIKVAQDAQKTDAQQANHTLLLSGNAEIDTKPQLEIYADDVKCSHGATIGQLNADSLFYLRARGIDQAGARSILTYAFVNEVLNQIDIMPLRAVLEEILASRLIHEI